MLFKKTLVASAVSAFLFLTACAGDPNKDTKLGVGIGAILGGIIGHQIDGKNGRYYGAAVGAIAGGGVGRYMDNQRRAMEEQLAEEARKKQLSIATMPGDAIRIDLASDVNFDYNSDRLRPEGLQTYKKIADILKSYQQTVVHVVGHTDSSGSDQYNQALSERRAAAVFNVLAQQGIVVERMAKEGRGEREPLANNATPEGQKANRRVDIVVKPIVEGKEQDAWTPPGYLGKTA